MVVEERKATKTLYQRINGSEVREREREKKKKEKEKEKKKKKKMSATASLSSMLSLRPPSFHPSRSSLFQNNQRKKLHNLNSSFRVQAAKLPAGVELPKQEPKLTAPFFGFTNTAEIWNSRTCMIGLIGTFIVELILNKGILETIGVEVGKGLDIPL